MLDLQDESGRLRIADAIAQLKCEIEFPVSWHDFFKETGPALGDAGEKRQFPRWKNRTLAGLLYRETFSVIPRAEEWHPIYLKDVSRGGAAFIHCEQLFPLERMRLLFIDDVSSRLLQNCYLRAAEVAWCRYVQGKCYEVGVQFVEG
jgi:hypothetical protein